MRKFSPPHLSRWMSAVLQAEAIAPPHADLTAALLLRTSLRGIDTHGVSRLPGYVQRIRAGEVTGNEPVVRTVAAALEVDGRDALGQVVGSRAIDAAVRATEAVAVAAATVRHSGHWAALGVLALGAAERGRVALVCQRTPPIMGLPGSTAATIGNNPLAFAAPVDGDTPLVFDMANSVAARGHILQAARDAQPIPAAWAVDDQGRPTTDAATALRGYLQPMAGHKGLGLAMLVEVLCAGLSGWQRPGEPAAGSGSAADVTAFVLVINPGLLVGQQTFEAGLRQWLDAFRQRGGERSRYPGQRQAACEAERRATGIPIPDSAARELADCGDSVGCRFDVPTLG